MPALSHDATQKAWIEMIHRYVAGLLGLHLIRQYYAALKGNCTRLTITLSNVLLQAIFGMWTVTWRLHPIAVMPHLIGGMTISTLLYLDYDKKYNPMRATTYTAKIAGKLKALWALCLTQIIIGAVGPQQITQHWFALIFRCAKDVGQPLSSILYKDLHCHLAIPLTKAACYLEKPVLPYMLYTVLAHSYAP